MSAYAIDEVERDIDLPVIGVVKPGARVAATETKNKRIGVIATEGTIGSGMYERFINRIDPGVEVLGKACPLFCPLVEEGMLDDPVTDEIARRYLKDLMDKDIDTLIMGCTHYPLLAPALKKLVGDKVRLVNPAYETARELKVMLDKEDMLNDLPFGADERHEFYVSDLADKFRQFAAKILDDPGLTTEIVDIEKY